ncbi:hypothetical protein BO99DRAFT_128052 [Aspergillus violaceofuscus CBS 115571]|uniref:Tyrosine specific protein phosphatases domain-containing protein n=1 Tax=Aspergillus violaceofuscus (strain CBS 115571) TaxID=1450538 RepID=A0A2V5HPY9_ASPV1|nr:hypothetical protein BO99DRAFT_128052 [Aspergillus violaceofuscus CBS 115571]
MPGELSFCETYGLYNFRDIGGYPCSNGAVVRRGFIYRSAGLTQLTTLGELLLRDELGIKYIFDLRASTEGSKTLTAGIITQHVPALDWEQSRQPIMDHFNSLAEDPIHAFLVVYEHLLIASGPAFKTILTFIKQHPGCPVLIHCDLGKDRTGILIALLLTLAGVSEEDVLEDYHLSERGIEPLIASKTARLLRHIGPEQPPRKIERHFWAHPDSMKACLRVVDEVYGGVSGYFRFLGLNDTEIDCIRRRLVEAE